ncbi:MAG: DUF2284 domain-containing protein [Muribaculaceae bacterium]|nr:DUF2284 domain-containing protein [Muribaculaceae bacterium]MDE6196855.1 DUF2284 domain-containing protein [Muribaculaceae bacterium]
MNSDLDKFISQLVDGGAVTAKVIDPHHVLTAAWPVMKCRYGCTQYGHNRCCPPFAPAHTETRAILDSFSRAIIFSTRSIEEGTPLAVEAVRALVREGYYKALAFGTGPCRLCDECHPAACPRPWDTAPSMEACGVDVFGTVRAAGLPLNPCPAEGEPLNCYGLVLAD